MFLMEFNVNQQRFSPFYVAAMSLGAPEVTQALEKKILCLHQTDGLHD